jgi:hypothetical protein
MGQLGLTLTALVIDVKLVYAILGSPATLELGYHLVHHFDHFHLCGRGSERGNNIEARPSAKPFETRAVQTNLNSAARNGCLPGANWLCCIPKWNRFRLPTCRRGTDLAMAIRSHSTSWTSLPSVSSSLTGRSAGYKSSNLVSGIRVGRYVSCAP